MHRDLSRVTLDRIKAISDPTVYCAEKIRGACALAFYDSTADPAEKTAAVRHLQRHPTPRFLLR